MRKRTAEGRWEGSRAVFPCFFFFLKYRYRQRYTYLSLNGLAALIPSEPHVANHNPGLMQLLLLFIWYCPSLYSSFVINWNSAQDNLFKDAMEYAAESKNAEVRQTFSEKTLLNDDPQSSFVTLIPNGFENFDILGCRGPACLFPGPQGIRLLCCLSLPVLRPPAS
jgi:hypothetical protein